MGIALKLTPAVFLLYFWLRRDSRAALTALASFAAATAAGFLLAWGDSWEYWTHTVSETDRIGSATLNTNQNIAGVLARLGLDEHDRFLLWVVGCFAVLAVTVWAVRRVLDAGEIGVGGDLGGVVRTGGIADLVVAPLGVDAAGGAGAGSAGLPATQRRVGCGRAPPGWR